jgi:hypothetical protein
LREFSTTRPLRPSGEIARNRQNWEALRMSRLLHVRQFFSDLVSVTDLWLIFGGVAVALLLAWLF